MKVNLASQIFSHTLSAPINKYVYLQAVLGDAIDTAQLIKHFDTLFDCCNSISSKDSKTCGLPPTIQSTHIRELLHGLAFIKSLKVVEPTSKEDKTKNLKCLKGWSMAINAIVSIWEKIHQESIALFLVTRQLSHDPLEIILGQSVNKVGTVTTQLHSSSLGYTGSCFVLTS